jgi:23S rRNA pseudouridine2605 synthase
MSRVRLQKAISAAGLMSRRKAEDLIRAARVTINGRTAVLGDRVEADVDSVEIDGTRIPIAPGMVTYLVYKPTGVVSTAADPQGRPTVVDLVPDEPRVVPVGRLDIDSEGLILCSNDGELTNRITHPRYGVPKVYQAWVEGKPSASSLRMLREGVELEDGPARALAARVVQTHARESQVEIIMNEGRNREVRRMFDALGHPVRSLVRTAIGPINDRKLKPGSYRLLTQTEVAELYRVADRGG